MAERLVLVQKVSGSIPDRPAICEVFVVMNNFVLSFLIFYFSFAVMTFFVLVTKSEIKKYGEETAEWWRFGVVLLAVIWPLFIYGTWLKRFINK